jgi:hypothetical protein
VTRRMLHAVLCDIFTEPAISCTGLAVALSETVVIARVQQEVKGTQQCYFIVKGSDDSQLTSCLLCVSPLLCLLSC